MASHQQRRLVAAVAELAHAEGIAGVTVSGVSATARISRKTFYEHFRNREECVEYACKAALAQILGPAEALETAGLGPGEAATARLEALLEAVAVAPRTAELALLHAPALGGASGRRLAEVAVGAVSGLIGAGEGERAKTFASAMIGVICWRLGGGETVDAGELSELVGLVSRSE